MATLTKSKLYEKGFDALKKELGLSGAIRFVSSLKPWDGNDSVKVSREFGENNSIEDIIKKAKALDDKKSKLRK